MFYAFVLDMFYNVLPLAMCSYVKRMRCLVEAHDKEETSE